MQKKAMKQSRQTTKRNESKAQTKTTPRRATEESCKTSEKQPEERLLTMYAQGSSYAEIAEAESITAQEAVNMIKERRDRANTLRAIALQSYVKENKLDSTGRIELLSTLRKALEQELSERGLREVAAEKLVTLLLKANEQLRAELDSANISISILSEEEQKEQQRIRDYAKFSY